MNEKTKKILIKITLTIPALFLGVFSALMFLFKPVIELWADKALPTIELPPVPPEDKIENHTFY